MNDRDRTRAQLIEELRTLREERAELQALADQGPVLELLATGQPLRDVIERQIRTIEASSPGLCCEVSRLDDRALRLRSVASPSLPQSYTREVDGIEVGAGAGPSAAAVYRAERVIEENLSSDSSWPPIRRLASECGVRGCVSQPIFSSDGEILGTFTMYRDEPGPPHDSEIERIEAAARLAGIAIERRRSEEALQQSEMHLRQIIDLVPHMIFVKDRRGDFLLANAAVADAYGTTVGELVGCSQQAIHDREDEVARMRADDLEVIDSGRPKFVPEEEFTDARGRKRLLQTIKIPFRQSASKEPAILGVALDITDRRELEGQLSHYERSLESLFLGCPHDLVGDDPWRRELFDLTSDFCLVLSTDGTIIDANRALARALEQGVGELIGRKMLEFVAREFQRGVVEELCSSSPATCDSPRRIELVRADGTRVETAIRLRAVPSPTGEPNHRIRVILHDISRRRHFRRRLLETEQLVTTGRLAASVAHSINNPLQSLLIHLELIGQALPETFAEPDSWERVEQDVTRLQQVVRDLLDLNGIGETLPETVDVNSLILEAVGLTDSRFRADGISVEVELDDRLPGVVGVGRHLYQVILNLLLNASEAVHEGGSVRVSTSSRGGRVVVVIEDDGSGIRHRDRPRVFDPMFTTQKGRGAGLGLFVSRHLVHEHDGEIEVESEPGRGTLIRVVLPRADPAREAPPPKPLAEVH